MKTLQFFLLICLAAALFSACKKDNDSGNAAMQGTWQGKWGSGNQAPSYFLKFKMESNGNMQRLDEQNKVIANGTWTLNGIEFECIYTHVSDGQVHRIGGLYTDFDNTIIGRWGYSPSKANGGEIELVKQ
ncbi:MAG: hypothetical protein KIS77_02620 [Saprospiraceae bacterium]|nr:hypothetical protein [Saprospiraceae bacterium]